VIRSGMRSIVLNQVQNCLFSDSSTSAHGPSVRPKYSLLHKVSLQLHRLEKVSQSFLQDQSKSIKVGSIPSQRPLFFFICRSINLAPVGWVVDVAIFVSIP